MKYKTIPRNTISKEYELNPKNVRRRELTVRWLKKFNIENKCLDCGDRSLLTDMIEKEYGVKIQNTTHNLDWKANDNNTNYANIFICCRSPGYISTTGSSITQFTGCGIIIYQIGFGSLCR